MGQLQSDTSEVLSNLLSVYGINDPHNLSKFAMDGDTEKLNAFIQSNKNIILNKDNVKFICN
jgi:hypothetical protein